MSVHRRRLFIQFNGVAYMIFASAVVDVIDAPPAYGGLGKFKVNVWGKEPHDYVRIYEIQAKTEGDAAREGIDRFVADIEQLLTADEENPQ
jgi:hypothetical protein